MAGARQRCARELQSLGFTVRERPFEFSSFVGRFAFPILGGAAATVAGVAAILGSEGHGIAALVVLAAGLCGLFVFGQWFLGGAVLTAPLARREGVNLEATIAHDVPQVWLCAHIDSKSQPVTTLARTIGIVLESVGVLAIAALCFAAATGRVPSEAAWTSAALVTLVGAMPVVMSVIGSNSPGALDNASGVAAVVAAAREMRGQRGVGVLITDAEELALAGARAWGRQHGPGEAVVLNCDGIDDIGGIVVMYSGRRPDALTASVARASAAAGVAYRERRLGVGIFTDSVAFTDAGIASVTFSRGTLRSLARVHGPRDDLAHLRGIGIADASTLMAATARDLVSRKLS